MGQDSQQERRETLKKTVRINRKGKLQHMLGFRRMEGFRMDGHLHGHCLQ